MAGYLASKGLAVLRQGYDIIPVKPGEKFPSVKNWETVAPTEAVVRRWLQNGQANAGIGIRTGSTPMVDLDIPDLDAVREMQDFIHMEIGFAPVRIGNPPKRGLLFRAVEQFRKISSPEYVDSEGRRAQVEILGHGQQFVAYHIHPDTGKPYRWDAGDGPEFVPVGDLPVLTAEQGRMIVDRFNELAGDLGWALKRRQQAVVVAGRAPLPAVDDELGLGTDPIGLTDEELREKVMAIPNEDLPYEDGSPSWLHVMMAIWHESAGSQFGHDLALEWSEQSVKHEDERFEKSWNSFGKNDEGRRPVTARYLLKFAKEFEQQAIAESVNEILLRMDLAGDLDELKVIAFDAKKLDVDLIDRSRLISTLQKNAKRFSVTLGIRDAREMVRYEPDVVETPDWLKGWIYLTHPDRFFSSDTKQMITQKAFDNAFVEFTGDALPSDVALKRVKIERVHMTAYMPGEEDFFTMNGLRYANTYSERNVPRIPSKLEGRDRENVQLVRRHFSHMFSDEREIELFISWLAYIVQTKKRPNWAIVLQGGEGDGKNFFGAMMAAVLGGDNVRTVFAQTLEAPHNAWAEGQLFTFVEEVRMIGHNRHDIINRIKPLITNPTIEIHAKNINPYNVPNTTAYMLTTNFQNALPVGDNDRRYFILMSRWQEGKAIEAFQNENPDYFNELYLTLDQSAGAILGWLKAYKLHPEFQPLGRAPHSLGRFNMAELNKSEDAFSLEDIIEAGKHADVCEELVVVRSLVEIMADELGMTPRTRGIEIILRELGFTYIGRPKIGDRKESVWSKTPEKFGNSRATRFLGVRKFLENPL